MNKMLFTAVIAALFISGCSDKDDAAADKGEFSAFEKAIESTRGAASDIKDAAGDAMDSAGNMAADAKDAVSDAASSAMDKASDAKTAAVEAVAATTGGSAAGQKVYQASCQSCHAMGVAGAPKLGDKAAWAPRIATGVDALVASSVNGKGIMPPRGACASCSDDDLKAAVEYMVSEGM